MTHELQTILSAAETRAYTEVLVPSRPHLEALAALAARGKAIRADTSKACRNILPGALSGDPAAPFAGVGLLDRLFGVGVVMALRLLDRIDQTMAARVANADRIRAARESKR